MSSENERQETLAEIEEELRSGEYAPLADRIHAARKREFGNMAAMRDALMNIVAYAQSAECHTEDSHVLGYLNQVRAWVNAAIAKQPRNCDVGTAEEQEERYKATGEVYHTLTLTNALAWAQMPYDAEEGDGK
jgi:hypothetical protein